tara:strand:- start:85 stop:723 length:639 start_codon:yes stop_codon:yes gene_type:complete
MFNYKEYKKIREFIAKNYKKTSILAVSKNHPESSVREAIKCGIRDFGENRVQEARLKFSSLIDEFNDLTLHLTGPLQTNKVKSALNLFKIFHTLDREKLANEFFKHKSQLKNKVFFIQVNTGNEENKSGIKVSEVTGFSNYCKYDLKINIKGLMCIPPIYESAEKHFKILKKIAMENKLEQLSMGMSNDYKEAVMLDSSYIRIGTILFGKRE